MKAKYKILIWRDQDGINCKFGKQYGYNCWKTIWPCKRPFRFIIPIFKKHGVI